MVYDYPLMGKSFDLGDPATIAKALAIIPLKVAAPNLEENPISGFGK